MNDSRLLRLVQLATYENSTKITVADKKYTAEELDVDEIFKEFSDELKSLFYTAEFPTMDHFDAAIQSAIYVAANDDHYDPSDDDNGLPYDTDPEYCEECLYECLTGKVSTLL